MFVFVCVRFFFSFLFFYFLCCVSQVLLFSLLQVPFARPVVSRCVLSCIQVCTFCYPSLCLPLLFSFVLSIFFHSVIPCSSFCLLPVSIAPFSSFLSSPLFSSLYLVPFSSIFHPLPFASLSSNFYVLSFTSSFSCTSFFQSLLCLVLPVSFLSFLLPLCHVFFSPSSFCYTFSFKILFCAFFPFQFLLSCALSSSTASCFFCFSFKFL